MPDFRDHLLDSSKPQNLCRNCCTALNRTCMAATVCVAAEAVLQTQMRIVLA